MAAAALRTFTLMAGSVMVGAFWFGAASVSQFHRHLPVAEAWRLHQFVSRRIDWFVPASTFLTMAGGFALLVVDTAASTAAKRLTLAGAVLIMVYGLPFMILKQGLRTELAFVRWPPDQLDEDEARQRMRWWNGVHFSRLVLGTLAQLSFVVAAILR